MKSGWRQLRRFRLRSALVICCAALGVAGSITAVNYASGGQQRVLEQIRRLGTNVVVVSAKQSQTVAGRERTGTIVTTLVEADYVAIRRNLLGPVRASARVSAPLRLKAGFLSKIAPVVGVEPDYFPIKSWELVGGSLFGAADIKRSARVALLGHTVACDLFGDTQPVGEHLFINRVPFKIIGVLAERGEGLDNTNEDGQIFVPLTAAMRRLLNRDYFDSILFEIPDVTNMAQAERGIVDLLSVRHRITRFRSDDFQVQSQRDLIETQLASSERLGFLVRWIGFSALVVAGLGILAIAWIAVRDRTKEIGTRRALGATAPDIFFQFVFEATVLATFGVALGLGLGWWVSRITAEQTGLVFVFDSFNAMLALVMAFVLNLLFASWPALRAARLDPIRALQHE
ncbi:MAG: ABC transporter permease [Gammaproteobacteria bacterium]|jgi:putative ABC transport system permease protein|nr:ABC transporter permease [Gammaproteobacteria bacterium]